MKFIERLSEQTNTSTLIVCVSTVYQNLANNKDQPGAERWHLDPDARAELVNLISFEWASLTGYSQWQFPYSETFTLKTFIDFRKLSDGGKRSVRIACSHEVRST